MNRFIFSLLLGLTAIFACRQETETATVHLRLTDGPADYDAVNIDIQSAEVHLGDDTSGNDGWYPLTVQAGVYNLLELANGLDTLIAQGAIPPGKVTQVRLVLGDNNTIMVDSVLYDLDVVANNVLKINLKQDIQAGQDYAFLLDFDAGKSIVETGNGKYKLKPVIRAIDASTSGAIRGYIDPAACKALVTASDASGSYSTFTKRPTGYFFIQGLAPGAYEIRIEPKAPCSDTIITGIIVEIGRATDMGFIGL